MFIKENKVHLDLRNSSTGLGTYKIMKNFSNMINLHVYTYSKLAYAYSWAAYAGPMYVHAYSSPETLIQPFCFCFFILFV